MGNFWPDLRPASAAYWGLQASQSLRIGRRRKEILCDAVRIGSDVVTAHAAARHTAKR
jgi:hypothetical protein